MDQPIKAGDLVMIVRGHVCGLGKVFRVARIDNETGSGLRCTSCAKFWRPEMGEPLAVARDWVVQTWRLKKIPPLEELQTWRQTDETTV